MSKTTNKLSPEERERAVRLVLDNEGHHGSRWQAALDFRLVTKDFAPSCFRSASTDTANANVALKGGV